MNEFKIHAKQIAKNTWVLVFLSLTLDSLRQGFPSLEMLVINGVKASIVAYGLWLGACLLATYWFFESFTGRVEPGARPVVATPQLAEARTSPVATIDPVYEWRQYLLSDGRIRLGTAVLDLSIEEDHMDTIARGVSSGEVDTLSLTALNKLGISRWDGGSELSSAHKVMDFLIGAGVVRPLGENQPCEITPLGQTWFPLPQPDEAVGEGGEGGRASTDTTTTTATTTLPYSNMRPVR